mgnify:CR=1 FL=1
MFDGIYGMEKIINKLKIVLRFFKGKKPIGDPVQFGTIGGEPDNYSQNNQLNKFIFNSKYALPLEFNDQNVKALIELQAPDAG